jgi:hypothetical protein
VQAQFFREPPSAAYYGFGVYSSTRADIFSVSRNQASLAQLKDITAGIYSEKRFSIPELNDFNAGVALPAGSGNFGVNGNYLGSPLYNESRIGLAYGKNLGGKLDAGVQFNYHLIAMQGYGKASAIGFELGTILHVSETFHAGIHASNPVGGTWGKEKHEKIPAVFTTGFGYEVSPVVFLSTEFIKTADRPININAGLQYILAPEIWVKAGVSSASSSAWIGAGFLRKSFRLDAVAGYHPVLGFTPGLSLLFHFKKKEK